MIEFYKSVKPSSVIGNQWIVFKDDTTVVEQLEYNF